jgi:hypothetical protein
MADAPKNTKLANRKTLRDQSGACRASPPHHEPAPHKGVERRHQRIQEARGLGKGNAAEILPKAYQAIDKAVKGGILKKNTAARMKSGLAKKLAVK